MGKNKEIEKLTNLLSMALAHRIGSITNRDEYYAKKYETEAEEMLKRAQKIAETMHWNLYDKQCIKALIEQKLRLELEHRHFLNEKKFSLMDAEIATVLKQLALA